MLLLQQSLAVLLVLSLLAGMLMLLRRKGLAHFSAGTSGPTSRSKQMRLLERLALSPQHSLHLVNIRNHVYVIGISPSGCSAIVTLDDVEGPAELKEPA